MNQIAGTVMNPFFYNFWVALIFISAGAANAAGPPEERPACLTSPSSLKGQARKEELMVCMASMSDPKKRLLKPGINFREEAEFLKSQDGLVIREVGTVNGIPYQIFHIDGSGSFAGQSGQDLSNKAGLKESEYWSVSCKRDAMSDKTTCRLSRGDFYLFVDPIGAYSVSVGTANYPGKPVTVRTGSGEPVTTLRKDNFFDAATSQRIAKSILKEESLKTRYMKWPNDRWIDAEYSTHGFSQALEYVVWATKQSNK